jgi:hypothetical protein
MRDAQEMHDAHQKVRPQMLPSVPVHAVFAVAPCAVVPSSRPAARLSGLRCTRWHTSRHLCASTALTPLPLCAWTHWTARLLHRWACHPVQHVMAQWVAIADRRKGRVTGSGALSRRLASAALMDALLQGGAGSQQEHEFASGSGRPDVKDYTGTPMSSRTSEQNQSIAQQQDPSPRYAPQDQRPGTPGTCQ